MRFKPRPVPAPQPEPPKPVEAPKSAPVVVPAPVVNLDNRAVAASITAQNENLAQLKDAIDQLAAKMEHGTITVTVTEWTSFGRIKSLKITKG